MKQIPIVGIIDDDEFFQYVTRKLIEVTAMVDEILQFSDGENALEYFLGNQFIPERTPDLVFLDINMPYMDGWTFLDEFTRKSFAKELVTIYICTSSGSREDKLKFESYPQLEGYLIKPIVKSQIEEILTEALRTAG